MSKTPMGDFERGPDRGCMGGCAAIILTWAVIIGIFCYVLFRK
jgi:hypothetical protein